MHILPDTVEILIHLLLLVLLQRPLLLSTSTSITNPTNASNTTTTI